ncbi:Six-hairpin glycosidase-like protein, partial [Dactylonectria macrodidyma]
PDLFPHYTLPGLPYYVYHDSTFWTSGFFPGNVWLLYERSLKTPLSIPSDRLLEAARKWQMEMAKEQFCRTNHDLGFTIMPSFYRDYVLTGARSSLEVVVNSARSLAARFDETTSVIRSWAGARTKVYDLNYSDVDYVVVIDGMMNLDLLYVAAQHTSDQRLANVATKHVNTTLRNHVRKNYSTYHLVNYDARDGSVRNRLTCQGYANESTWDRGQAWALYGFASVYHLPR